MNDEDTAEIERCPTKRRRRAIFSGIQIKPHQTPCSPDLVQKLRRSQAKRDPKKTESSI